MAQIGNAPASFTDIDSAPEPLRPQLEDLALLGVPEFYCRSGQLQPNAPLLRRVYARWLVSINNMMHKDATLWIRKAEIAASQPVFSDVGKEDPDFDVIQGLAEAGLVPSQLLDSDADAAFHPNDVLTREDLICLKIAVDLRMDPPPSDATQVQSLWRFRDANKMSARCLAAIAADKKLDLHSNITRALTPAALFLASKPVSNAEGMCSLWFIGDGRDDNREECTVAALLSAVTRAVEESRASNAAAGGAGGGGGGGGSKSATTTPMRNTFVGGTLGRAGAAAIARALHQDGTLDFGPPPGQGYAPWMSASIGPSSGAAMMMYAQQQQQQQGGMMGMNGLSNGMMMMGGGGGAYPSPPQQQNPYASNGGGGGGYAASQSGAGQQQSQQQRRPSVTGSLSAATRSKLGSLFGGAKGKRMGLSAATFSPPDPSEGGGAVRNESMAAGRLEDRDTIYSHLKARSDAEDLRDVEQLAIFQQGVDKNGRPTLWVNAKNVPAYRGEEFLERLFLFTVKKLDAMTLVEYVVVVLIEGADPDRNIPEKSWLTKAHEELPRRYKKNLGAMYIIQPTLMMKMSQTATKFFGGNSNLTNKIKFLAKRDELRRFFDAGAVPF